MTVQKCPERKGPQRDSGSAEDTQGRIKGEYANMQKRRPHPTFPCGPKGASPLRKNLWNFVMALDDKEKCTWLELVLA